MTGRKQRLVDGDAAAPHDALGRHGRACPGHPRLWPNSKS